MRFRRRIDVGFDCISVPLVPRSIYHLAGEASHDWGCVPVTARIGEVEFLTSLFLKGEACLLPLRAEVRRKTGNEPGDSVTATLIISTASRIWSKVSGYSSFSTFERQLPLALRGSAWRPVATAIAKDGALLLAGDVGNSVWRVTAK